MKLYHIDRTMTLKGGNIVNINNNIDITDSISVVVYNNVLKNYNDVKWLDGKLYKYMMKMVCIFMKLSVNKKRYSNISFFIL